MTASVMKREHGFRWSRYVCIALVVAVAGTGCPTRNANNLFPQCTGEADEDGDRLSDCEEIAVGTATHLADTDGDGFSDFQEVVEFGFHPDNNRYKFNPRIADIPRIQVALTSPPAIDLIYDTRTETGVSRSVERSEQSSQQVTTGTTATQSQAIEYGLSVGQSVTVGGEFNLFKGGFSGHAETTVNYQASVSSTQEQSFSWSREQTQENSQTLAEIQALTATEGTSIRGGILALTLDVVNDGDIAFTLTNLLVSAVMATPNRDQVLTPIGGLSYDTSQVIFPVITYGPDQRNGPYVFKNDSLPTGVAQALLGDSTSLDVRVVGYELTDQDGRSFTHNQTAVAAKTATVLIDYGGADPLRLIERYSVATNIDRDTLRITARQALHDILGVPYVVGSNGALLEVRGVAHVDATRGYWAVAHKSTNGVESSLRIDSAAGDAYDFDSIELKSGDVLHLIYYADSDADGLGTRQEIAYGTDPKNPDSDGDCAKDGQEVYEGPGSPLVSELLCSRDNTPAACSEIGGALVMQLDSRLHGSDTAPVTTARPLVKGRPYLITVKGNFSAWENSVLAANTCPSPYPVQRPSPSVPAGTLAGWDAEYVFAAPGPGSADYNAARCDTLANQGPIALGSIRFSTDGGDTFFDPTPLTPGFAANHVYRYQVTGTGKVAAFQRTGTRGDDHGVLEITIQEDPICALPLPSSCASILRANPDAGDGEYTLYHAGDPERPWTAYCHSMASSPREYLSLPNTGPDANFSQYTAGGASPGTNVRTRYSRVRIHPLQLSVEDTDMTFATSSGLVTHSGRDPVQSVHYALATSCNRAPSGRANIDLSGTPFAIASSFCLVGFLPAGTATLSQDGQVADLTGGGYCGSMIPCSRPLMLRYLEHGEP
jgi:hypothetical protein